MDDLQQQAEEIRILINDLEAQLDAAFATASRLSLTTHGFGAAIGVTKRAGQATLEHVSSALAAIGTARGRAIQAHREIERIGKMAGYGDGSPKPAFFEEATDRLSVVAEAA